MTSSKKKRKALKKFKPWFDDECRRERSNYMKIKNKLKGVNGNSQDDASKLKSFNSEASKYKKILKKKKREYFKNVNKKNVST